MPLLSKIKETTFIFKSYGETFTLWCSSHPCTATTITDSNAYNSAKIIEISEYTHQGRVFRKVISDVNDTATYCCVLYCAKDTEPCCVNIRGMCIHKVLESSYCTCLAIIIRLHFPNRQ